MLEGRFVTQKAATHTSPLRAMTWKDKDNFRLLQGSCRSRKELFFGRIGVFSKGKEFLPKRGMGGSREGSAVGAMMSSANTGRVAKVVEGRKMGGIGKELGVGASQLAKSLRMLGGEGKQVGDGFWNGGMRRLVGR